MFNIIQSNTFASALECKMKTINNTKFRPWSSVPIKYKIYKCIRNRGSYMRAHVLLNLLNELGKRDKM